MLLSILLSNYGIHHVLLESQALAQCFQHPQAHFLNTRSMEIIQQTDASLYASIRQLIPPVSQWSDFQFMYNMNPATTPLATVRHPVHQPLQALQDANGTLLLQNRDRCLSTVDSELTGSKDLSPCTVGHLAQHQYARILYEHAQKSPYAQLVFNTTVTNVLSTKDESVVVETNTGQEWVTSLVVAADGAHSRIRSLCGIPFEAPRDQNPTPDEQHLLNIHVRLSSPISHTPVFAHPAMLYSIYNEHTVAMVVCHNPHEYVIQVPLFHPYQTHEDVSVTQLVRSIFGLPEGEMSKLEIVSARPWTMTTRIAHQYYSSGDRPLVVLVGDAAHVFPPAGGFGMNTGIGDVHNLAWKLAALFLSGNKVHGLLPDILRHYSNERKPVAEQNAALSQRNYQRLLEVTKSCYLDNQHPQLLKSVLHHSPLPFAVKRNIFQQLLKTALYPLSWLQDPKSSYFRHLQQNLHRQLQRGTGLPLLFPDFELNYTYDTDTAKNGPSGIRRRRTAMSTKEDSFASSPVLQVGRRIPHVWLQEITRRCRQEGNYDVISSLDLTQVLSGQRRSLDQNERKTTMEPTFVLLLIGRDCIEKWWDCVLDLQQSTERDCVLGVSWKAAGILFPEENNTIKILKSELPLYQERIRGTAAFSFTNQSNVSLLALRPDGHVGLILDHLQCLSKDDLRQHIVQAMHAAITL